MNDKDGSGRKPVLNGTVLGVEDDPDIRAMTVTVLQGAGAKVVTAATADEALAMVNSSEFDALILDWHLSGTTGSALLASVRTSYPRLFSRSAVVTGDLFSIPGEHEAESFGRPVLAKPFRFTVSPRLASKSAPASAVGAPSEACVVKRATY